MPKLGTFDEVAAKVVQRERNGPWEEKVQKLVWRGKISMAPKLRRAFMGWGLRGSIWGRWISVGIGLLRMWKVSFFSFFAVYPPFFNSLLLRTMISLLPLSSFPTPKKKAKIQPTRAILLRLPKIPPPLPLGHNNPHSPVDPALSLPAPFLGLPAKLRPSLP
jgi:hypothetical protein